MSTSTTTNYTMTGYTNKPIFSLHNFRVKINIACTCFVYSGVFLNKKYESGYDKVWLTEMGCNGTELRIDDCSHSDWDRLDFICNNYMDVWIKCDLTSK